MCKIVCNKSLTSNFIEMSLYGENRMGCDVQVGEMAGVKQVDTPRSFITEIVV